MLVLVVGLQLKVSFDSWSGTAWVLNSNGYLITADHVVAKGKILQVRYKGKWYYAQVIARDKYNDIAIIKIPIKNAIPIPVFQNKTVPIKAAALGYPVPDYKGYNLKIAKGSLSYGGRFDTDAYFHGTTCHGNSGGPIIDLNGNSLALVSVGYTEYSIDEWCTSEGAGPRGYWIIQLANKYGVNYEPAVFDNANPFSFWYARYEDSVLLIYGSN